MMNRLIPQSAFQSQRLAIFEEYRHQPFKSSNPRRAQPIG
jgi:hypothetical protein